MRARLLQFVTGSSRVPLQGFKALQGMCLAMESFTCQKFVVKKFPAFAKGSLSFP